MDLIQLTINNKSIFVQPHSTVLQACEAANVDVPRFCYHEKLSVAGNCRMCLVEVAKSPKPVVSCARPVAKGRVVFTDTPLVRKARESVLEFLLLNHPLDCPICDQGGECDLQDESLTYGSDRGRYFFDFKRSVEDKECGPIVKTVRTRCIHCTRCVRFSSEIAGNEVMGSFGRGEETEIGTYVQSFIKTELSGNLVDLCPVGALTSKPYAYKARSWEVNRTSTIDLFDSRATDIVAYTRNQGKTGTPSSEKIRAIRPIKNGIYSENWISDRTRYAFDGLYASNRFANKTKSGFQNNYEFTSNFISNVFSSSLVKFSFGSQTNLETIYSVDLFNKINKDNTTAFHFTQDNYASELLLDYPFSYSLNKSVGDFATKPIKHMIRIGANPRYEASILNTRLRRESKQRGATYITVGSFNPLAYAQVHKGNSTRAIINRVENRVNWVKESRKTSSITGVYLGANNLRNSNSAFMQKLVMQYGKFIFAKNNNHDRLGYIHDSVGSLAFAHMNFFSSGVNASYNSTCFINSNTGHNYSNVTSTVFSTHFDNKAKSHYSIPSFYESNGHVISIEGSLRSHQKVVTPVSLRHTFEIIANYARADSLKEYYKWGKLISKFTLQVANLSTRNSCSFFAFNPFAIKSFFVDSGKLTLFVPPISDFYRQDQIASASSTRAECSLFLKQDLNKTNFFNEKF